MIASHSSRKAFQEKKRADALQEQVSEKDLGKCWNNITLVFTDWCVPMCMQLKAAKEQLVTLQTQLEQEEEAITNKLMKRLDMLKKEKAEVRS